MSDAQNHFGQLLRQAREIAELSRDELAQRVEIDASHIYRMEIGERRPSRETALALAEALGVEDEALNKWLMAAGYAPMPLLTMVRAAVRTRGGRGSRRRPSSGAASSADWNTAHWARWLEAMGLQEVIIGRLLRAMESASLTHRKEVAKAMSTTFYRVSETLEAPVHIAVIPAAGGQHRILAPHMMQRLLLYAIGEALESGVSKIILVLSPGTIDSLYTPLKEALELSVVPSIKLHYAEQAKPQGLGDAILQAEAFVGKEPFAVLLPDDVVHERMARTTYPRELRRMMEAFRELDSAHLVAVISVPKSKMPHCGVAKLGSKEFIPKIFPIIQLIEKPDLAHPICRAGRAFGIVGRYLLQPDIFCSLRELKEKGHRLELTDALERLRQTEHKIYAFELKAKRQDVGEVLEQASGLIGDSSESRS